MGASIAIRFAFDFDLVVPAADHWQMPDRAQWVRTVSGEANRLTLPVVVGGQPRIRRKRLCAAGHGAIGQHTYVFVDLLLSLLDPGEVRAAAFRSRPRGRAGSPERLVADIASADIQVQAGVVLGTVDLLEATAFMP